MTAKHLIPLISICLLSFPGLQNCHAQDSPVEYMNQFTAREQLLSEKYLSYMSEVAHRGRARKMEKRRVEVVNAVKQNLKEAGTIKPFKSDVSLRDAYKEYWTVLYHILNEDYAKVVDMEEVAEQSYDAMEAYLLIQEKASEKLHTSSEKVALAYTEFAKNQNVRLVSSGDSELSKKLGKAGLVNQYSNRVYLIFFKSFVQENSLMAGLNALNLNSIEQAKGSLRKFSSEGLAKLDTLKPFQGDGSLATACKKVLDFHQSEADKSELFTSFLIKKEDFEKFKKTVEAKPASKRTQAELDQYNKLLNDYNNSVKDYNKVNNELNSTRSKALDYWEKARAKFMDTHVPRS
ncbi:MAG TPA: hypothetical protein VK666_02375 [Chryseolinea sp.]|nr:hypothetical protein [Chryseolinea sp.]